MDKLLNREELEFIFALYQPAKHTASDAQQAKKCTHNKLKSYPRSTN
ncbi:hypothetical protein [Pseudoalteromonas sp.]